MISSHSHIRLSNILRGLSTALDLMEPTLTNHHRQVAWFAGMIASAMRLSDEDKADLEIAASLHDIGAISFGDSGNVHSRDIPERLNRHAQLSYLLLRRLPPFSGAAKIVRDQHWGWRDGGGTERDGRKILLTSHVLHLANQVATGLNSDSCLLGQAKATRQRISAARGIEFAPQVVDAFLSQAKKEAFWLEAEFATSLSREGASSTVSWDIEFDLNLLWDLSELFRIIIDFRSRSTAAHSKCVAHVAEVMARYVGFSNHSCGQIHIAGNLHDLGKLAVPVEVLEKKGSLTDEEIDIIRSHPFHTFRILQQIGDLGGITAWAAYHHENPAGSGYPFRISDEYLPLGSRIVAIADVFVALTEPRSYREGLARDECLRIMRKMAEENVLDRELFLLFEKNFEELQAICQAAQEHAAYEFTSIRTTVTTNCDEESTAALAAVGNA